MKNFRKILFVIKIFSEFSDFLIYVRFFQNNKNSNLSKNREISEKILHKFISKDKNI